MDSVAQIEQRIASFTELLEIITALRALAALRLQECQRVAPGLARYAAIVDQARIGLLPSSAAPAKLVVVFGSDHGFVGGYNERLIDGAVALLGPADRLAVVGRRAATLAAERGLATAWSLPMASHAAALVDLARSVGDAIASVPAAEIVLVHCGNDKGAVGATRVLPAESRAGVVDGAPFTNLDRDLLARALLDEYLFARYAEAALAAFTAENRARLMLMDGARRHLEERLDGLRRHVQQQRQAEITAELLDIVAGVEALADGRGQTGA